MATRKKTEAARGEDKPRARGLREAGGDVTPAVAVGEAENEAQLAQMKKLEQGLRLFREQRLAEAREWFEAAAKGPRLTVSLTAKNHISVCERRMQKATPALQSAEDHYNFGIERLNARDLESARKHLGVALALKPQCDYMLYGLAAALALSGDSAGACENLRRAIEADPRNRNTARQDPDFAMLAHNPIFFQLLHPDRGHPA